MATQHVAFCPSTVVVLRVVAEVVLVVVLGREITAAPNAASVAKISFFVPGRSAVPKSTDVPAGEDRVSFAAGQPSCIGSKEMNPVLFFIGSPFTRVMSIDSSSLNRT